MRDIWLEAAKDIRGQIELQKLAYASISYKDEKEAYREHCNVISCLGVLLSKFRRKAGDCPKDIFQELKTLPSHHGMIK